MEYLPGGGQVKAADQYTIQTLGVPSLELMERAAGECVRFFEEAGLDLSCVCIVCGSGNNGGDGFAIGRLLLEKGGKVTLLMAGPLYGRNRSPDGTVCAGRRQDQ